MIAKEVCECRACPPGERVTEPSSPSQVIALWRSTAKANARPAYCKVGPPCTATRASHLKPSEASSSSAAKPHDAARPASSLSSGRLSHKSAAARRRSSPADPFTPKRGSFHGSAKADHHPRPAFSSRRHTATKSTLASREGASPNASATLAKSLNSSTSSPPIITMVTSTCPSPTTVMFSRVGADAVPSREVASTPASCEELVSAKRALGASTCAS